jgi:hypothetical protein
MASAFACCFCLPLCKRGIEGDLLFASNLLESEIKSKSKSPLTPLFQRGEPYV